MDGQPLDSDTDRKFQQWQSAKHARDFVTADRLREELRHLGVDAEKRAVFLNYCLSYKPFGALPDPPDASTSRGRPDRLPQQSLPEALSYRPFPSVPPRQSLLA